MDAITLADFTLGRGVLEPGWRWSNDVKPIAGTDSCQTRHTGFCLSGQMAVQLDDGSEVTVGPATSSSWSPDMTPGPSAMRPASFSTAVWRRTQSLPERGPADPPLPSEAMSAFPIPHPSALEPTLIRGVLTGQHRRPVAGSGSGGSSTAPGRGEGYFANCAAARAAGAAPVYAGGPGDGPHLEREGDGIACE